LKKLIFFRTGHEIFFALALLEGGVGEALGDAAGDAVEAVEGERPLLLEVALAPTLVQRPNLLCRVDHRRPHRHERFGARRNCETEFLHGWHFRRTVQQRLENQHNSKNLKLVLFKKYFCMKKIQLNKKFEYYLYFLSAKNGKP